MLLAQCFWPGPSQSWPNFTLGEDACSDSASVISTPKEFLQRWHFLMYVSRIFIGPPIKAPRASWWRHLVNINTTKPSAEHLLKSSIINVGLQAIFIQINMLNGLVEIKIDTFLLSGVYTVYTAGMCYFPHSVHLLSCVCLRDKGADLRQRLWLGKAGKCFIGVSSKHGLISTEPLFNLLDTFYVPSTLLSKFYSPYVLCPLPSERW